MSAIETAERLRNLANAYAVATDSRDDDRVRYLQEEMRAALAEAGPATTGLVHPFAGITDPVEFFTRKKEGLRLAVPGMDSVLPCVNEEIVLLGALPSAGKSTLAVQIADEALGQGWRVLVCAFEQGWRTWEGISAARIARLNSRHLLEGTACPHATNAIRSVLTDQRMAFVAENRIYADPPPSSIAELESLVRQVQSDTEHPRKLLVIADAIQDFPAEAANRREGIDAVIAGMRHVARTCGVPILATSHVNSEGEYKESRGLLYKADVGLLLEAEPDKSFMGVDAIGGQYNVTPTRLTVTKNRDGEAGVTAWLDFHMAVRRFEAQRGGFD